MNLRNILRKITWSLLHLEDYRQNLKYRYEITHIPTRDTQERVAAMRKKETIRVAFIVYDVPKWKTEELYLQMLAHPRFEPVIVPVFFLAGNFVEVTRRFNSCIDFLKSRDYPYVVGEAGKDIDDLVNPDIVFYGEPYPTFNEGYRFHGGRKSLPIYVSYSIVATTRKHPSVQPLQNQAWLFPLEHISVVEEKKCMMPNHGANLVATGIPLQDVFLKAFENHKDVWKPQPMRKKRIIWAPSHTIPGARTNSYEQSNFLLIADDMLRLADKYKEQIQWTFKPHPNLRWKLVEKWGQERADAYYSQWELKENTQLEQGQYIDLFMSSDAMIHDSMSFIVEYMFTENPIMFLDNGKGTSSVYNTMTSDAYALHYKGGSVEDIERYIQDVVLAGNDPLREKRMEYKQKYLVPPYGKTASQNIINAILGEEEFADK